MSAIVSPSKIRSTKTEAKAEGILILNIYDFLLKPESIDF